MQLVLYPRPDENPNWNRIEILLVREDGFYWAIHKVPLEWCDAYEEAEEWAKAFSKFTGCKWMWCLE